MASTAIPVRDVVQEERDARELERRMKRLQAAAAKARARQQRQRARQRTRSQQLIHEEAEAYGRYVAARGEGRGVERAKRAWLAAAGRLPV